MKIFLLHRIILAYFFFQFFVVSLNAQKSGITHQLESIIQLVENGKYFQAKLELNKVDSTYDNNFYYHFYRGITEFYLNINRDKSIDCFEHALSLSKSQKISQSNILSARYFLAKAYFYCGDVDRANKLFNRLYVITPARKIEIRKNITQLVKNCMIAKEIMLKPVRVKVYPLYSINTLFKEHSPLIIADETQLVFTSTRGGSTGGKISNDGDFFEDIYISKRESTNWGQAVRISEDINSPNHEAGVWMSMDGKELFIYRSEVGNGDIYVSELSKNNVWSTPKSFDIVNSDARETSAFKTYDNKHIFFTSDRKGGLGKLDIYEISKLPNMQWSEPVNLGPSINTSGNEENPFYHPDGKLYFSSDGLMGMGGYDIYVSEKKSVTTWSIPKNMGYPVNSVSNDLSFIPSVDGVRAYLASDRIGGKGRYDIYFLQFDESYRTNIALVSGNVRVESGYLNLLKIEIEGKDFHGFFDVNLYNGNFIAPLKFGQQYKITLTAPGNQTQIKHLSLPENPKSKSFQLYNIDSAYLRVPTVSIDSIAELNVKYNVVNFDELVVDKEIEDVPDFEENDLTALNLDFDFDISSAFKEANYSQSYSVTNPEKIEHQKLNLPSFYNVEDVLFDVNQYKVIDKESLNDLVNYLLANKEAKIKISGYADASGSTKFNSEIAHKRALSIYNALLYSGIDSTQLLLQSFGEFEPLIREEKVNLQELKTIRTYNRRAEFSIVEPANNDILFIKPVSIDQKYKSFILNDENGIKRDTLISPDFVYFVELISTAIEIDLPKQIGPYKVEERKTKFGVFEYYIGGFTQREDALFWLREVKNKGFTMAKLTMESIKEKELGYFYSIHLLMSENKVDKDFFRDMDRVIERNISGVYHYYYGQFLSLSEAEKERNRVVGLGYDNAFIFINDYSDVK